MRWGDGKRIEQTYSLVNLSCRLPGPVASSAASTSLGTAANLGNIVTNSVCKVAARTCILLLCLDMSQGIAHLMPTHLAMSTHPTKAHHLRLCIHRPELLVQRLMHVSAVTIADTRFYRKRSLPMFWITCIDPFCLGFRCYQNMYVCRGRRIRYGILLYRGLCKFAQPGK